MGHRTVQLRPEELLEYSEIYRMLEEAGFRTSSGITYTPKDDTDPSFVTVELWDRQLGFCGTWSGRVSALRAFCIIVTRGRK